MVKGVMVVTTSPAEGREADYNQWYDEEHIPALLSLPGFVSARRFRVHGEAAGPTYLAIYELEADDLNAPVAALRARNTPDRARGPEVLATSPPGSVTLYEEIG
jgi:hypothetical protein